ERRDLPEEVVEELDEVLALVDVVAQCIDAAEAVADVGALEVERIVAADLDRAGDRVADAVGELARRGHALLVELVDLALQARDQVELRRIERDGGEAEPEVLVEDEDDVGDEQAALEHRQADRFADEAADGLGFGDDHRDQLAGRRRLEVRQREPQHQLVQVVAQPAHRALADDARVDVDPVLEAAVERDQREQQQRQPHQVRYLRHREPEELRRNVLAADRAVDDALGNLEIQVDERKADRSQHQHRELVAPRELDDVAD